MLVWPPPTIPAYQPHQPHQPYQPTYHHHIIPFQPLSETSPLALSGCHGEDWAFYLGVQRINDQVHPWEICALSRYGRSWVRWAGSWGEMSWGKRWVCKTPGSSGPVCKMLSRKFTKRKPTVLKFFLADIFLHIWKIQVGDQLVLRFAKKIDERSEVYPPEN